MIRGLVNASNEAIVRIRMRGPGHPGLDVDMVVDSGFTSTLALAASTIAALGLIQQSGVSVMLADGSSQQLDTYTAEMSWDGSWRPVLVCMPWAPRRSSAWSYWRVTSCEFR
jgi:predicted aspartyl protease